ncbi:hypothetical protein [Haloarchaeobius sp. TZWSO28]|uniref:hypothetical protein n=1 Tax=Haloarchaeobius sp. TZWSO28 TaxID=3446119 RepID=UPI003EBCC92D
MNRSLKAGIIAACFIFSAGMLHTHTTGSYFPGLPVAVIISSALLYVVMYVNSYSLVIGVIVFTGISVLYRVYLFISPESMLRLDPDAHAVRSQVIVQTGHLSGIVPDFYHDAPIFHILGSGTALITGLPIDSAYVVFPIVVGISMSVYAAVLAKCVSSSSKAAVAAAAIGAVSASTIKYSIGPIPMTLAAMYLACSVMTTMLYRRNTGGRYLLILILCSIVSALTHKIPILLLVFIFGVLAVYTRVYSNASGEMVPTEASLFLILGISLLALQWIYLADFTRAAVRLIYGSLLSSELSSHSLQPYPSAAIFIDPSVFVKVRNLSYYFVSTGFAAIVGISLFRHADNRNVRIIQAAALATVSITLPSLALGTSPGFKRVFVYGSIFVAVLIAIGVVKISTSSIPNAKMVSIAVVLVILIVNPLSVVATPDFPGTHRTYFTQKEVEGKHFMNDRVPEKVYLDMYYGDEVFNFSRAASGDSQYQRTVPDVERYPTLMSKELTEGTLTDRNYPYIGIRTNVVIYRLKGGRYALTWSPQQETNRTHHRIYSNGGTTLYRAT